MKGLEDCSESFQRAARALAGLAEVVASLPCPRCGGKRETAGVPVAVNVRCRSCEEKLLMSSRVVSVNRLGDAKVEVGDMIYTLNAEMRSKGFELRAIDANDIIWDDDGGKDEPLDG